MKSTLKKSYFKITRKFPCLRPAMKNVLYAYRRIGYCWRTHNIAIDEKKIVFSSFNGRSYNDNPKAIYEEMLRDERFKDFNFVWLISKPDSYQFLQKNPRTIVVKYRSASGEYEIASAKYWVFNSASFKPWIPKKQQVYLQCWHGTPLKRIGFDITKTKNELESVQEIHSRYKAEAQIFDYLISPARFVSKQFVNVWNLAAVHKEDSIIETGYPRNDFLVNHAPEDVIKLKRSWGFENLNKKIILYAPTFRDNQNGQNGGYIYEPKIDFDYLRQMLDEKYIILFRAHYLIANSFDFSAYEGFVYDASRADNINDLYVIADVLVTDYSSAFFDFAILRRPIVFYMYDLEQYRDEIRGFYLDLDDLPGEIVKTSEQLVQAIEHLPVQYVPDEKYEKINETYNYLNDGRATKRVIDCVFGTLAPVQTPPANICNDCIRK